MAVQKQDIPYIFIKKKSKPITEMTKEKYEAAKASVSKYIFKKDE